MTLRAGSQAIARLNQAAEPEPSGLSSCASSGQASLWATPIGQVIREAILAAWRTRREEQLRAEAEAVAADPEDRAETRAVLADMESLRAW